VENKNRHRNLNNTKKMGCKYAEHAEGRGKAANLKRNQKEEKR